MKFVVTRANPLNPTRRLQTEFHGPNNQLIAIEEQPCDGAQMGVLIHDHELEQYESPCWLIELADLDALVVFKDSVAAPVALLIESEWLDYRGEPVSTLVIANPPPDIPSNTE